MTMALEAYYLGLPCSIDRLAPLLYKTLRLPWLLTPVCLLRYHRFPGQPRLRRHHHPLPHPIGRSQERTIPYRQ